MIDLNNMSTRAPKGVNKNLAKRELGTLHRKIFHWQNVLFAEGKHPILIILQGMDTSGKDGTIRHVFSCLNPMGCNVKSFRAPNEEEKKHDFLAGCNTLKHSKGHQKSRFARFGSGAKFVSKNENYVKIHPPIEE